MRDNEEILNKKDDKRNIYTPIIWAAAAVLILLGLLIWFGIKQPVLFNNLRDLVLTIILFLLFIIGGATAVIFFILAARINSARTGLDEIISKADGKVEELADKTVIVLQKILEPFIKAETDKAGILSIFSKKKTEE